MAPDTAPPCGPCSVGDHQGCRGCSCAYCADLRGTATAAPRPYYEDDLVTLYHGDCLAIAHLARIGGDGEDEWVEVRCPHPTDSTECGLMMENLRHDPDACAYYDEGEDGCSELLPGWEDAHGCSVREMLGYAGMTVGETFNTYDTTPLPRGEWFPVTVTWDGSGEDAVPALTATDGDA